MKKLFAVLIIFTLVLAACDEEDGNGDENGDTTLTVINSSDYNNLEISYGDTEFGIMKRGDEVTKKVSAGTKFIYIHVEFFFQNTEVIKKGFVSIIQGFEANEVLTCEEGKNNQFNFTSNTVVTMRGGDTGYIESGRIKTGSVRDILASIEQYYIDTWVGVIDDDHN